jgi:hypothetical protein
MPKRRPESKLRWRLADPSASTTAAREQAEQVRRYITARALNWLDANLRQASDWERRKKNQGT